MSQIADQARSVYDKFVGNNTTVTSTNVQQGQVVGGQVYGTTYTQGPSVVYGNQASYSQVPQDYKLVNQTFQTSTGGYSRIGQSLTQKVVAEEIPVESRIEYIPFEKKYIEYDQVERIERIPFEREIVEYEEVTRTERIPIERTITDYYAVETQIEYIPKEIEETIVEYEPVERVWERVQYLPVETQIVHYPERDNYVAGQGQYIKAGYVEGGYSTGYQQVGSTTGYQQGVTTTSYVPTTTNTTYIQGGYPVEGVYTTTYVQGAGQSGVRAGLVQGGSTTQYVNGPVYTTGQTYTTTGQTYVTGGSGVRGENVYRTSQTGGYVTGGSGVRQ
jgi:hypothetical protein